MKKEESNGACNVNLCLNVSWTISGAQYCDFPEGWPARGHPSDVSATGWSFLYPPSNRLSQFLCYNLHFGVCLTLTAVLRSPYPALKSQLCQLLILKPEFGCPAPLRTGFPCLKWIQWFLAVSKVVELNGCMWYTEHNVRPMWVTQ